MVTTIRRNVVIPKWGRVSLIGYSKVNLRGVKGTAVDKRGRGELSEDIYVHWDNGHKSWHAEESLVLHNDAPGAPVPFPPKPAIPSVSQNPFSADPAMEHAKKKAKPDMNMLMQFPNALTAAAEVLAWANTTKGYGFQEFKKLQPNDLRAALMRHTVFSGKDGTEKDAESEKLHAIHVLTNALMWAESLLSK